MKLNILREQKGFTLYELLITLGVSTFILMAALSSLTDFIRVRGRTQFNNRMLATSELIFSQLSNDMHQSQDAKIDMEKLTLTTNTGDIVYSLDSSKHILYRNGDQINPDDVKVTGFQLESQSPSGTLPLIKFDLELRKTSGPETGSSQIVRSTTISLRSHRGEKP